MIHKLLESIVSAEAIRRDGTLLDVTFLKDFGPWNANQLVAQLKWQDDWLIELDINGEEVRRLQVMLSPLTTGAIHVIGRHRSGRLGLPDFYASFNNNVLRVDDRNHPDFWLEAHLGGSINEEA